MIARIEWSALLVELVSKWSSLQAYRTAARRRRVAARSLRARCEAALRDLPATAPFDEHAFCAALAAQRGRPIRLWPLPLRAMTEREVLYGLLIDKPSCDIIAYERDTSRAHQQQIILHEACHLILGHRPTTVLATAILSLPQCFLEEGEIRHVQGRSDHATEAEHEAEVLASLILEQAAISTPTDDCAHDLETMRMLVRLSSFYRLKKSA